MFQGLHSPQSGVGGSPHSSVEELSDEAYLTSTAPVKFSQTAALAVVGIDFGTSMTGYAYLDAAASVTEPALTPNKEPFENGLKTQTDVLISLDNERVVLFGKSAYDSYMAMDDDSRRQFAFFRRFKMCLYKDTRQQPRIRALSGEEWDAVRVFAACLRYIKDHAIKRMREKLAVTANDVFWVLTVPAIWSDASKQLMRDAAHRARMISDSASEQLTLVLEPEAAAITCKETMQRLGNLAGGFAPGTCYILLDAGGGTLDSVVHRVKRGVQVEELQKASGDSWGSTNIDRAYEALLVSLCGDPFMRDYIQREPQDYARLLASWEEQKLRVKTREQHRSALTFNCILPESFLGLLAERNMSLGQQLDKFEKKRGAFPPKSVGKWRLGLQLTYDGMMTLFSPTLDAIIKHAQSLLQATPDCRFVFLVGGLGDCDVLHERLKDTVKGQNAQVVRPEKASLAVLMGAVRHGQKPMHIVRRMRHGYGVGVLTPYTAQHKTDGRREHTARLRGVSGQWADVYRGLVTIDELVPEDEGTKTLSCTFFDDAETADVTIYKTKRRHPTYPDEEGVDVAGSLTIPLLGSKDNRDLLVTAKFGGAELEFELSHVVTGTSKKIRLHMFDNVAELR